MPTRGAKKYVDCNTQEAVFHPLKSVNDYVRCLQQAGQPATEVNFFAMNQLPSPVAGPLATKKRAALVISCSVASLTLLVILVATGARHFKRRKSGDRALMHLEEASFLGSGTATP